MTAHASIVLIDDRAMLHDFRIVFLHDKVAVRVQRQSVHTIETQRNAIRVRMRLYNKVVFELLLVTVVNKVDAGIDTLVSDSRIGGNVGERCPTAKVMNLAEL